MTINITLDWRVLLILSIIGATVFYYSRVSADDSQTAGVDQKQTESPSIETKQISTQAASGTKFYITADPNVQATEVLSICATGYHAASLWEILDISNLSYAYDHPEAYTRADSGNGPPSGAAGWVRTGFASSASATAGRGNCNVWTSSDGDDDGTTISLSSSWETAPGEIFTWQVNSQDCGALERAWCIED